jgi:glutamine amidotransferase
MCLSLGEWAASGGGTAPHAGGRGVACYHDLDVRLIKDSSPARNSARIPFICEHQMQTPVALAHLRKATQGRVANFLYADGEVLIAHGRRRI